MIIHTYIYHIRYYHHASIISCNNDHSVSYAICNDALSDYSYLCTEYTRPLPRRVHFLLRPWYNLRSWHLSRSFCDLLHGRVLLYILGNTDPSINTPTTSVIPTRRSVHLQILSDTSQGRYHLHQWLDNNLQFLSLSHMPCTFINHSLNCSLQLSLFIHYAYIIDHFNQGISQAYIS